MSLPVCLVCGGRSDGAHFGAKEACRACAAFFRRTVSMGKGYSCRTGGNCEIEASIRCMCRSCRFIKCEAVGMNRANVQNRRDQHGPRYVGKVNSVPESTGLMFISEDQGMPMLRRLHTHHMQLRAVRRAIHRIADTKPKPANLHDVDTMNMRELPVVADFILSSFPQLSELMPQQRKLLYQFFYSRLIVLECAYSTSITPNKSHVVLVNGDYVDTNNISIFYSSADERKVNTPEAVRMFTPSFTYFHNHLVIPMSRLAVDEYELFAFITLLFWDYDEDRITLETRVVGETVRDELLSELAFYYRYVKRVPDEMIRVSQLLLLLPPLLDAQNATFASLQRMGGRFAEDVELSKLFQIYSTDLLTFDIINQRV